MALRSLALLFFAAVGLGLLLAGTAHLLVPFSAALVFAGVFLAPFLLGLWAMWFRTPAATVSELGLRLRHGLRVLEIPWSEIQLKKEDN